MSCATILAKNYESCASKSSEHSELQVEANLIPSNIDNTTEEAKQAHAQLVEIGGKTT